MNARRMLVWSVLLVALLATLTGCTHVVRVLGPKPEDVTRQWYVAASAYDTVKMDQLVHPERRTAFEMTLKQPESALVALIGLQKQTYFDMRYELMTSTDDTAEVRATGKVANRLGAIEPVLETVSLRKADRSWYVWTAGDWIK